MLDAIVVQDTENKYQSAVLRKMKEDKKKLKQEKAMQGMRDERKVEGL